MQGTIFRETILSGTKFRDANLTGVISRGIQGKPTLPSGWVLKNGFLIGPGANLNGANLSNVYLGCMDLSNTNLTYAFLYGSTLTNANLQGALMFGARMDPKMNGQVVKGKPKNLPTGWTIVRGKLKKS